MKTWLDSAVVLSRRPHGVGGAVVTMHAAAHGRVSAFVHGIRSAPARGLWLTGNVVSVAWRGASERALGFVEGHLEASPAADLEGSALRLAALASACSLVCATTPQAEPAPLLHADLCELVLRDLFEPDWMDRYAAWERRLCVERGYGTPRCPDGAAVAIQIGRSGQHLSATALSGSRRGLPFARRAFGATVRRVD
jgi:recombinational DNA repair protein (RecF pathway)